MNNTYTYIIAHTHLTLAYIFISANISIMCAATQASPQPIPSQLMPASTCETALTQDPVVNGVNTCPLMCQVVSQSLINRTYKCLYIDTIVNEYEWLTCYHYAPYLIKTVNSNATISQQCATTPICGIGYFINPQPTPNSINACPDACKSIAKNASGQYFCIAPNTPYTYAGTIPTTCPANAPYFVLTNDAQNNVWKCSTFTCGVGDTINPQPVVNGANECPAACNLIATRPGTTTSPTKYFCIAPNIYYPGTPETVPTTCPKTAPNFLKALTSPEWKCSP